MNAFLFAKDFLILQHQTIKTGGNRVNSASKIMKKTILTKSVQTRVANRIEKEVRETLNRIFSEPSEVSKNKEVGSWWREIVCNPKDAIFAFAEIDTIREVVDKYKEKYHGISYSMCTRPYLAQDNETWLYSPVMEINIRRYEKDIFNK